MKLFINKVVLYLLPVFCFVLYVLYIHYNHNFSVLDKPAKLPSKYILGEPYSENILRSIKLDKLLNNTKIIALGSSRVLQFSQDMFQEPFYNLGYTAASVYQITNLIKSKNIRNKTIIIGIDQWSLNPNWPEVDAMNELDYDYNLTSEIFKLEKLKEIVKMKIHPAFFRDKHISLIGSGANMAMSGILNDGFYYAGNTIHGKMTNNPKLVGEDYEFKNTKERIKENKLRFEYCDTADDNAIKEVNNLLQLNEEMNNRIIIFFPPFAPEIYDLMLKTKKYEYIKDASVKIKNICDAHNVPFYDFTSFDSKNSDYLDGFHGGQWVYYNMASKFDLKVNKLNFLNPFENEHQVPLMSIRTRFFGK